MRNPPGRPGSAAAVIAMFLLSLAPCSPARAQQSGADVSGHAKLQFNGSRFPGDSLFGDLLGSSTLNRALEARLKLAARRDAWTFDADYQFIAIHADTLGLSAELPDYPLQADSVISDDRRWWDLTYSYGDPGGTVFVHRLDRLSVGLTTANSVWRFGRQAISWGNGLLFTPMDVFNPFDPAAVDKEYKTGDDMLYGQYLFGSGSDLQGVLVVRRNPLTGNVERDQSSLAFKYHGFLGANEYDLLAAEHFGDRLLGIGGSIGVRGAIWRGDLTWTDTERESVVSAVTSLSYSWNWGGHNVSGLVEYYYSGFGQEHGAYSASDLLRNPDLVRRLARGELYTLARHYLGLAATVEMTPLFRLTPNLFVNLQDPSALAQLVAQYDWRQNLMVTAALNIPIGPDGSEYGGIESPFPGRYLSTGPGLFAQFAWYF